MCNGGLPREVGTPRHWRRQQPRQGGHGRTRAARPLVEPGLGELIARTTRHGSLRATRTPSRRSSHRMRHWCASGRPGSRTASSTSPPSSAWPSRSGTRFGFVPSPSPSSCAAPCFPARPRGSSSRPYSQGRRAFPCSLARGRQPRVHARGIFASGLRSTSLDARRMRRRRDGRRGPRPVRGTSKHPSFTPKSGRRRWPSTWPTPSTP